MDVNVTRSRSKRRTHPKEEGEFPAVKSHPEELWFQPLLFHNVVVVGCLHFLQTHAHSQVMSSLAGEADQLAASHPDPA